MPKRKTIEEVKEAFEKRKLTVLDEIYKNNTTPMDCIDKDGYKYKLSVKSIEDTRTWNNSKFATYNPYTMENIKNYIKLNDLKCELLSTEFKNTHRDKLEFMCSCGNKYSLVLQHFLNFNKQYCNICSAKIRTDKLTNTVEYIENVLKDTKYSLVEGIKQSSKRIHIKDELGYKYLTTIYNVQNREDKYIRFGIRNPYQLDNIKLYMKLNHIKCKMITDEPIENAKKTMVEFECSNCGSVFKSILYDVLYENRHRCPRCSKAQSNISLIVEDYLKFCKIEYIKEYKFTDCKNINPLPFDFYLPKFNTCIEVQGSQHYRKDNWFTQELEERQRIDKIKENYCKGNHIGYLAIPYWNISNGEKIKYKELINNIIDQN